MNYRTCWNRVALIAAALSPSAWAGGIEQYCVNSYTNPLIERWPTTSGASIPWTIVTSKPWGSEEFLAPGYPDINCTAAFGGWSTSELPVVQSLARACLAWNTASQGGGAGVRSQARLALPSDGAGVTMIARETTPLIFNNISPFQDDGENLVSFWNDEQFQFSGAEAILAVTSVVTDHMIAGGNDVAAIVDVDMAFNSTGVWQGSTFTPNWSWVEWNDRANASLLTPDAHLASASVRPLRGYAEIQGVATHEFGHFLGLAHSLIDSTASASTSSFPTMFPMAQAQTFAPTVVTWDAIDCNPASWAQVPLDSQGTSVGGILGSSASTLTRDDVVAIGYGYPRLSTPGQTVVTGSITGTVRDGTYSTLVPGAHVVAVSATNPNATRVGTLSDLAGNFQIKGLLAGNYYVYAETVDQKTGGQPWNVDGYYFLNGEVPNFVWTGFGAGGIQGCVQSFMPVSFAYLNTDAQGSFAFPTSASTIAVGFGQTVQVGALSMPYGGLDRLLVTTDNNPAFPITHLSPRGVVASAGDTVEFYVPIADGETASVYLDWTRSITVLGGQSGIADQIREVQGGQSVNEVPGKAQLVSPTNGYLHFRVVLPAVSQPVTFRNVFAQAVIQSSWGTTEISNPVNIWVATP